MNLCTPGFASVDVWGDSAPARVHTWRLNYRQGEHVGRPWQEGPGRPGKIGLACAMQMAWCSERAKALVRVGLSQKQHLGRRRFMIPDLGNWGRGCHCRLGHDSPHLNPRPLTVPPAITSVTTLARFASLDMVNESKRSTYCGHFRETPRGHFSRALPRARRGGGIR